VGHLPTVKSGGSAAPKPEQPGKATGPNGTAGLPKSNPIATGLPWLHRRGNSVFHFKRNGVNAVRSTVINKILSFQYRLGKFIGRKKARRIGIFIERTFTNLFGREVYCRGK
jgi:hypothetical protein